jgi:prophage regulatory protein
MSTLQESKPVLKIIRLKQVVELIGLSRSTVYDILDAKSPRHDPTFPKKIHLTACSVGWIEGEVNAWLESRILLSRGQ